MIERGKDRRQALRPSRGMISGELSWAAIALVLAWSGSGLLGMDGSYLNQVMERSSRFGPLLWTVLVGAPALALMTVSLREYLLAGREAWPLEQLEQSAAVRAWLSAALAFSWLYMLHVLTTISARPSALRGLAIAGLVFCAWFVWENRRVQRECRQGRARAEAATVAGH